MHVAQLNIARALYPLDDPRMTGFVSRLEAINAIAERSPGFVWRLQGNDGAGAIDLRFSDDAQEIANMSVWENAEALEQFVWNTAHKKIYDRKHDWFEPPKTATFVMWPVAIGRTPTLEEGLARLAHLHAHGSSDDAYGWDHLPHLKTWLAKQCG